MTTELDITRDVCPLTGARVGRAVELLPAGDTLTIILRPDALKSVMSALKSRGVLVGAARREAEDRILVEVHRPAPGAGP